MKPRLPVLRPREVLSALQRGGFEIHHVSGSHYILRHPERPGTRVTLPFHRGDLKRRTLESIVEQAGFSTEEFLSLL